MPGRSLVKFYKRFKVPIAKMLPVYLYQGIVEPLFAIDIRVKIGHPGILFLGNPVVLPGALYLMHDDLINVKSPSQIS